MIMWNLLPKIRIIFPLLISFKNGLVIALDSVTIKSMKQQQRQSHQLKQGYYLSQHHMKLMHIMHLSGYALQEYIANELEQNPALEKETETEEQQEEVTTPDEKEYDAELWQDDDDLFDKNYKLPVSHQEFYEAPVVQYYSLQENLKEQVHMMKLDDESTAIACFIIDELDDDGYLRRPVEDVAFDYGFANGRLVEAAEVEKALVSVQKCEPAGVGARTLRECLLLQLLRKKNESCRTIDLCIRIFEEQYQNLVQRHFQKIRSSLKISQEELEKCIATIGRLNPKPVSETNKYEQLREQIIPDFEVTEDDGQLFVSLTASDLSSLYVNPEFASAKLNAHSATEQKQAENYVQNLVTEAHTLINALKERETTMRRVMTTIVQMQTEFFKTGDVKELKPMILQDISNATGYDISTISRITSNKYVQTPFGIFSLKSLFMRGLTAEDPSLSPITALRVQELIQDIIKEEDKNRPLSDTVIAELLKKRGAHIARRTVVKYRELMGIPNSTMRKVN
jgi:RNA polymerase sigma-54 factor